MKKKATGKATRSAKPSAPAKPAKAAKKKAAAAAPPSTPKSAAKSASAAKKGAVSANRKRATVKKSAAPVKAARKKATGPGSFHPAFPELKSGKLGVLIGKDERREVLPATMSVEPFSAICKVRATFPRGDQDGNIRIGTAWFVSPEVLLTAGHVVYQKHLGGAPSKLEIWSPALNKWQLAANATWTSDWEKYGKDKPERDFGAIKASTPSASFFTLEAQNDSELRDCCLTVCGYPGDLQPPAPARPKMYGATSRGCRPAPEVLNYPVDTKPGESGGPVFMMAGSTAIGVAIHNYGEKNVTNSGTRITSAVLKEIEAWIRTL